MASTRLKSLNGNGHCNHDEIQNAPNAQGISKETKFRSYFRAERFVQDEARCEIRLAVRHPETCRHESSLRFPPVVARRPLVLGRAQGAVARSFCKTLGYTSGRSSAGIRLFRRHN